MALVRRLLLVLSILLSLTAASASARIINVPADQPTLADVVAILESNDTVYVQPGEYSGHGFEGLEISGTEFTQDLENVLITSTSETEPVVINISEGATFVKLSYCNDVIFHNFHFKGGHRALWCSYESYTWSWDCIFDSCEVGIWADVQWTGGLVITCEFTGNGKGIYLADEAHWVISSCSFTDCETGLEAGYTTRPEVSHCTFFKCFRALDIPGGALYMRLCTIYDCTYGLYGYGWAWRIYQNLIAWNMAGVFHAYDDSDSYRYLRCNNVWGNQVNYVNMPDQTDSLGNISVDPLLCDPALPDGVNPLEFPLLVNPLSRCIDFNNPCQLPISHVEPGCDCCRGTRGNVDADYDDDVDISDLTAMISHLFVAFDDLRCVTEADITEDGAVDISDLTRLINHLFITFEDLPTCEGK